MEFSRQEYWSGLPLPTPGDLPDLGIEHTSPALAGGFFTTAPPGKAKFKAIWYQLVPYWDSPTEDQNLLEMERGSGWKHFNAHNPHLEIAVVDILFYLFNILFN